jgi:hypothetical protein
MINHVRLYPFIFGLVVGIIAVLFVKPEQAIVYKYPNPESKEQPVYKDKNGICYRYKPSKVDCDKNEGKLKEFPLSK